MQGKVLEQAGNGLEHMDGSLWYWGGGTALRCCAGPRGHWWWTFLSDDFRFLHEVGSEAVS